MASWERVACPAWALRMAVLGGVDAVTFTGGIAQYGPDLRQSICANLGFAGIAIDQQKNETANGNDETRIDDGSGAAVWVLPTNEELIVARQTMQVLTTETV